MTETPFALSKSGQLWNINVDANGNLEFNANSDTGGDTRMFIDDDTGNVGIGTTTPQAKLAVVGNIALQTGGQLWNVNVDSSGNLRFNANAAIGGSTKMFIHDDNGNVGIGTTNPGHKLHVVGNICATGSIGSCSDRRLKKDFEPLTDSLGKVLEMRGARFQWRQDEFPDIALGEGSQVGFIGQEMEGIYPEAVFTDTEGFKYLDYSRLTPVLVEAIKEQQQLIEQQRFALDKLQAKIEQLEATVQSLSS